jgi:catechol 2,3-dioxygenase-like lactoylglutathione lyase family enzyme
MACKRDKNTNCCYWLHMPPSDTERTAAATEALESKGIYDLVQKSDAIPILAWYIRKYRQELHDAGIEVADIREDDDYLYLAPPQGLGIDLGPKFSAAGGPGSTQSGQGKTKRRTRRKKGTKRKRRRRKRKSKRRK